MKKTYHFQGCLAWDYGRAPVRRSFLLINERYQWHTISDQCISEYTLVSQHNCSREAQGCGVVRKWASTYTRFRNHTLDGTNPGCIGGVVHINQTYKLFASITDSTVLKMWVVHKYLIIPTNRLTNNVLTYSCHRNKAYLLMCTNTCLHILIAISAGTKHPCNIDKCSSIYDASRRESTVYWVTYFGMALFIRFAWKHQG